MKMKRSLKVLGFAFLAAMALSAVMAAGAQAATFTRGDGLSKNTVITGHQEGTVNFFGITENKFKTECKVATYESTFLAPAAEITVTPHYAECVATGTFGTVPTIVHLNGCHYVFHAGEYVEGTDTAHGSADVVCPVGQKITITIATLCQVHVPPQVGLKTITYTNKGPEGETLHPWVTVDANVSKIKYEETKQPSVLCPFTEKFVGNDGTFVSKVKIKGYEDEGNIKVQTPTGDGKFIEKTAYKHPATDLLEGIDVR